MNTNILNLFWKTASLFYSNVLVVLIGLGCGNWVMTKINVMTFAISYNQPLQAGLSHCSCTILSCLVHTILYYLSSSAKLLCRFEHLFLCPRRVASVAQVFGRRHRSRLRHRHEAKAAARSDCCPSLRLSRQANAGTLRFLSG